MNVHVEPEVMAGAVSIGIDIGGTFTDFTVIEHATGNVSIEKVLSTPSSPEQAVLTGLKKLTDRFPHLIKACVRISHASTLVTNAILERKGSKVALLATEGFRDILETRLENRFNIYDLFVQFPEPIVQRDLRIGVRERTYSDGEQRAPLDEDQVRAIAKQLHALKVQSVAVSYLHSYHNPAHEMRTGEILKESMPGATVSLSHQVNPELREYERTSTTVLDAYIKPLVDTYLSNLETGIARQGFTSRLDIMLSNGGSTTAENARSYPIQMIESGPAAGVEASIWVCRELQIDNALSFDMGGTTAKLCVVRHGTAGRSRDFEAGRIHRFVAGSGFPVKVPVYDLIEIGAGGGSIAHIDSLGLIGVGPESAGAAPGPACYGFGGTKPTVTDVNLLLGYIGADRFLGGEMTLDVEASRRALSKEIAEPLKMDPVAAAVGVFDVVNELMASAARLHIADKGVDPAKLTVIAFGGAGPLHASQLARKLGCPRVVFPPYAGVMSSVGLLTAPAAFERVTTVRRLAAELEKIVLVAKISSLREEIAQILKANVGDVSFRYIADMWHRGQEFPLDVLFDEDVIEGSNLPVALSELFAQRYFQVYGRSGDPETAEVVSIRVIGELPGGRVDPGWSFDRAKKETIGTRLVYDPQKKRQREYPIVARASLSSGDCLTGPIVVEERETSFVVHSGQRLTIHPSGAAILDLVN